MKLKIVKGVIARPAKAVIYGPEGIGKTSLAAKSPDPLFIDTEGGSAQMDVNRVEPPLGWQGLIDTVKAVAEDPEICKTLVVDTADWAEQECIDYICAKYGKAGIEEFGYGKGYTYLAEEYAKLLTALDQVIASGKNVIVTAHAKLRKQELPDEAGAFDRWEMKLSKQVAPLLKEWCDALLFLNFKTYVITMENDTKKAQGSKRVIYTTHHACWDGKNRHDLPEEVDLEYQNIARIFDTTPAKKPIDELKALMERDGVSAAALQKVVSDKGKYPAGTPIEQYDPKIITGWIIKYWPQIKEIINKAEEAPTNKEG